VYNFVAAVLGLGVFYGIYLAATQKSRGQFFIEPNEYKMVRLMSEKFSALQQKVDALNDNEQEDSLNKENKI
jgi:hypothetical protein